MYNNVRENHFNEKYLFLLLLLDSPRVDHFSSAFSLTWTSLALSNFFLVFFYIENPIAGPW